MDFAAQFFEAIRRSLMSFGQSFGDTISSTFFPAPTEGSGTMDFDAQFFGAMQRSLMDLGRYFVSMIGSTWHILLAAWLIGWLLDISRATARRKKLLNDWIDKVTASSSIPELARLYEKRHIHAPMAARNSYDWARYHLAVDVCRAAHDKVYNDDSVDILANKLSEEPSPGKRAALLLREAVRDPALIQNFGKKAFAKQFYADLERALLMGRAGMLGDLEQYHTLVTSDDTVVLKDLGKHLKPDALELPEDWDEIVVALYDNPPVGMLEKYADLSLAEVRQLAGEADLLKDFVKAKVVLAYCLHDDEALDEAYEYREVIGSSLMRKLIRIVAKREVDYHK